MISNIFDKMGKCVRVYQYYKTETIGKPQYIVDKRKQNIRWRSNFGLSKLKPYQDLGMAEYFLLHTRGWDNVIKI